MVKISYEQKPQRKTIMQTFGANVISSPSNTTNIGKKILSEFKNTNGSLGCAISEAIEKSVTTKNCRYVLGSVLDHVLLHQSIIGQEVKIALDKYKIKPDIIIGCVGGGSNFGGLISPFIKEKISNPKKLRLIAVEPASCPTLTRGKYMYDFGDTGKTTPLIKMYTLGSAFIPSPSHAGGLRYHGMSPTISKLYRDGIIEARSVTQTEVFKANEIFSRTEGILPAPESGHAIKAAIDEAMLCKKNKTKKVIVFCLSGTGFFDLQAYSDFYGKKMIDKSLTKDELEKGFSSIPK
jgi:tryptophan synthase beta chain